MNVEASSSKKKKTGLIVLIAVVSIAIIAGASFGFYWIKTKFDDVYPTTSKTTTRSAKLPKFKAEFKYDLQNDQLSDFDIAFLKAENTEENKVYSPLSIKYTLKMLQRGAKGQTREQLSNVLGDYMVTKYTSNPHMSLANALFVRDSFRDSIEEKYISSLKTRYDAEVIFDSFATMNPVNEWIKEKTMGIIPSLLDPNDTDKDFLLVNALGIDMEWKNKFLWPDYKKGFDDGVSYDHENYYVSCESETVASKKFGLDKLNVSGMEIYASIDNYDIITLLGEDNIRKTVENAYREWIKKNGTDCWGAELTDSAAVEKEISRYLEEYMGELKKNYSEHRKVSNTDFSLYTDQDVKAFAKDLTTYEGTTLQYIGIMPTSKNLSQYINDMDSESINNILTNLKELNNENFKKDVITKITGYIPKFNFEYTLKLQEDLAKIGITHIFDSKKADISRLTSAKGAYISDAIHKANIEFTQDGIKAAAATTIGGKGAAGPDFDYIFEVPVEEIDLTFDQPYLFLVRDKATNDVWFAGTVYKPLLWENDSTKDAY